MAYVEPNSTASECEPLDARDITIAELRALNASLRSALLAAEQERDNASARALAAEGRVKALAEFNERAAQENFDLQTRVDALESAGATHRALLTYLRFANHAGRRELVLPLDRALEPAVTEAHINDVRAAIDAAIKERV